VSAWKEAQFILKMFVVMFYHSYAACSRSYSQGQVKRGHMDSLLHRRQVDEESAWHCSKIVCKVLNCRNGPIAIFDH